ncbi:bacterial transcriptional activator domain-containing protein [Streptomyces sp. NPDC054940]
MAGERGRTPGVGDRGGRDRTHLGSAREHTPSLTNDLELLQLPLLVDVHSPWIEEHQRTWDQRRFYALREAGEILLSGERLREAVEIAELLVTWEPLDEPSHLLLIRAHLKLGAPGRSTELYQDSGAACGRSSESSPRSSSRM